MFSIKFFLQQGFELDHTIGSHYILYQLQTGQRAVIPHRHGGIPKGTIMVILREVGFTKEDLLKFLLRKQ